MSARPSGGPSGGGPPPPPPPPPPPSDGSAGDGSAGAGDGSAAAGADGAAAALEQAAHHGVLLLALAALPERRLEGGQLTDAESIIVHEMQAAAALGRETARLMADQPGSSAILTAESATAMAQKLAETLRMLRQYQSAAPPGGQEGGPSQLAAPAPAPPPHVREYYVKLKDGKMYIVRNIHSFNPKTDKVVVDVQAPPAPPPMRCPVFVSRRDLPTEALDDSGIWTKHDTFVEFHQHQQQLAAAAAAGPSAPPSLAAALSPNAALSPEIQRQRALERQAAEQLQMERQAAEQLQQMKRAAALQLARGAASQLAASQLAADADAEDDAEDDGGGRGLRGRGRGRGRRGGRGRGRGRGRKAADDVVDPAAAGPSTAVRGRNLARRSQQHTAMGGLTHSALKAMGGTVDMVEDDEDDEDDEDGQDGLDSEATDDEPPKKHRKKK